MKVGNVYGKLLQSKIPLAMPEAQSNNLKGSFGLSLLPSGRKNKIAGKERNN